MNNNEKFKIGDTIRFDRYKGVIKQITSNGIVINFFFDYVKNKKVKFDDEHWNFNSYYFPYLSFVSSFISRKNPDTGIICKKYK